MDSFVAIDFETADYEPDSACAVGLVKVSSGKITDKKYFLIKPPRNNFVFTYLHGISWEDVRRELTFGKVWPKMSKFLQGADFLAAHNSGFDRKVLYHSGAACGIEIPDYSFLCTVQLSRRTWGIYPTKLPNVCENLGIDLNHHNALSDAEACAKIVLAAQKSKKIEILRARGDSNA